MTTSDWLASDGAVWIVQSLGHVLWQGGVLLILAGLLDVLFSKRSSQTRYAFWSMTLLLMFCCLPLNLYRFSPDFSTIEVQAAGPVATSTLSDSAEASSTGRHSIGNTHPLVVTEATSSRPISESAEHWALSGSPVRRPALSDSATAETTADDASLWQWASPYALLGYLVGVSVMLVRLLLAAGGTLRLRRTAEPIDDIDLLSRIDELVSRLGLRVRPVIATSTRVAVPVVVGVVKPMILLPVGLISGLEPAQLEAVLLHELAHIRRHDPLINLLQRCVETVLFFHPAVWIVNRRMRALREDCCDDIVLKSDVPACVYAESLVSVSELRDGTTPRHVLALAAVSPSDRSLRRRVLRILGESPGKGRMRVTRGAVLTLAVLIVASLSPVLLVLQGNATGQDAGDSEQSEAIRKLIGNDPGESIYNDKLKRFKFRLEKIPVRSHETAEAFFKTYNRRRKDNDGKSGDRPKLIGAWGDPVTNSIVIIGPPEAEQAIREILAEWESELVGVPGGGFEDTLEIREVYLKRERRGLLHEIALIELEIVGVEGIPDTPEARKKLPKAVFEERDRKLKMFADRVRSLEHELHVIERKLEVIRRSIRRRDGQSDQQVGDTAPEPVPEDTRARPSPPDTVAAEADGRIVWRQDGVVWINLGTVGRMKRGLQMTVTSVDDGSAKLQRFGRIEITRILDKHLSEARVLEETDSRPIAKGDRVFGLMLHRPIPLTLSPLKPGTIITDQHVGIGPVAVDDVPSDALLKSSDFIGRVVRHPIGVTDPIRERDLHPIDKARPARVISFDELKLKDGKVPEPIQMLVGKCVTITGFMYPPFQETGLKQFALSVNRDINTFGRNPQPHEVLAVELATGRTTDFVQDPIRVTGVLRTRRLDEPERNGIHYVLEAGVVHPVDPDAGPVRTPTSIEQQSSPQTVTQAGGGVTTPLAKRPDAKPTTVELNLTGPVGAQLEWPIPQTDPLGPDSLLYVVPARIGATSGKTVRFPITEFPGREGLKLFASLEVAPVIKDTAMYVEHNSIPLQITEEDIDQATSGNLVTKVVYLPAPQFQEYAIAGVETLVTTRLDPGVDPVVEAQRRGKVLAVLRLGNRQLAERKPARPRVTARVLSIESEGEGGVTRVEISAGSDDGVQKDDRLKIYRTSSGQGHAYPFVADVWIVAVTRNRSIGEVVRRRVQSVEVEPDDLVSLPWGAISVGGTVVGLKQEPLANVDVWLQTDYATGAAVHATTDFDGHFSLDVPREDFANADWQAALLWIYADGYQVIVNDLRELRSNDPDGQLPEQVFGLAEASQARFEVRARENQKPLAGVRVVPKYLKMATEEYPTLPAGLLAKLVQTTDDKGQVVIRGVWKDMLCDLQIESGERGTHEFNLRLEGYDRSDRIIELGQAGRLTGQVESDDPALLKGLRLYFRTNDPDWMKPEYDIDYESVNELFRNTPPSELPRRTVGVAEVTVEPDGRFTIPAIATGRLWLESSLSPDLPFGVRLTQSPVMVNAGESLTLRLHSAPQVTVSGHLTDTQNATVTSRTVLRVDDGHGLHENHVIFKDGYFETRVLAGDVRFRVEDLLDERDHAWKQLDGLPLTVKAVDAEDPIELPPIRVQIDRR